MVFEKGMYVRCPIDELENPRNFVCGQIENVDEFTETVTIKFHDPFKLRAYYENIPTMAKFNFRHVQHCSVYAECIISYRQNSYVILAREQVEGWFYYTIQNELESSLFKVKEDELLVPFYSGRISPIEQLRNYEFQNPAWYFGRSVVSRTIKILDNSVFGFKELAGCKIFLAAHQLRTIMRCLQENNCRYMLADEVGMGKTIEAASVLKVYLLHNSNKKVLIAVPRPLIAQWKKELFIKFEIIPGSSANDNLVELISLDEIKRYDNLSWDFVIVDEAHKLLSDKKLYNCYHDLSKQSSNILFLSATPVQQKKEAYLLLLRLILPERYDNISLEDFGVLVEKQESIRKNTYLVLQDYDDYTQIIDDIITNEGKRELHDECKELFEDIISGLKKVNRVINDEALSGIISQIKIDKDDYGRIKMQEAFLYICGNYQLEKNIIRNRRSFLSADLAKRTVKGISYELDPQKNIYEYATYDAIVDWIVSQNLTVEEFEKSYIPLVMAFFSSSWALDSELQNQVERGLEVDGSVRENAYKWLAAEEDILLILDDALAEPYKYSSRIINIIDFVDQEVSGQKVVLFTNYERTFKKYATVLREYFGEEKLAIFNKRMTEDELELNVYRFQNDSQCFMILCDETGGEGRNLQSADFVIHIDLPWDANAIEQRIGRLDRLGRDPEKDVCSVVVYTKGTLEEELFNFWNKGLGIFENSLSGLEIIMNEINESIIKAVTSDFRYGISNAITRIINSSQKMEKEVREEQHFDTAAFIYASVNQELARLLRYYSENENELFASTLLGWANLAGLKADVSKNDIVRFNEHSFSLKSAENSLLMPPNWQEYISKSSNVYSRKIRQMYEQLAGSKNLHNEREIVGTFRRDIAIENDFLHFFAPGDEIFDCIVDNAMKSNRGTCAAFAVQSDFEWMGIVFTWTLKPNEMLLLEKNIPLVTLRQYKNYISADQISTAVSFPAFDKVDINQVIKLLNRWVAIPASRIRDEVAHLGRRSRRGDFLHIKERYGCSNIEWFKETYPKEQWESFLNSAVKKGKEQAKVKFRSGNNIKSAIAEINRTLNDEIAHARFFGRGQDEVEKKRVIYNVVIQALKTSKFELESAAFMWVRKL